jgi:hypothetical protein
MPTISIMPSAAWRLTKVKVLPNYAFDVEFTDGTKGVVEMAQFIMSDKAGVFSVLKDKTIFKQPYLLHGVLTISLPTSISELIKYQEESVDWSM